MARKKSNKLENYLEHNIVEPLVTEFRKKDVIQVLIGSLILALPVSLTQETWDLGIELPFVNIFFIMFLAIFLIASFTYYQYHHKRKHSEHRKHFIRRVLTTYLGALFISALILSLIDKADFATEFLISIKRTIIISLPASISAVLTDTIR